MKGIDSYSYSNDLRSVHPVEKTVFSLGTVLICLVRGSIVTSLMVILIMSLGATLVAGVSPWFYLRLLTVPGSFLVVAVLTVVITVAGPEASEVNYLWRLKLGGFRLGIELGNLIFGLKLFLKSLGSITSLYFLILTTPVVELISVLKKCRVPKLFLELMTFIYHLLFVLSTTASRIKNSQLSRLGYSSLRSTMNSLGQLVSGLFVRSYYRAKNLIIALETRGYDGELKVARRKYKFSRTNLTAILLLETSLVLISIYFR
ncbi:MAG: cobalt ECF transporter T component CbiQ [Candidatus Bipolaricaulota bacterium]|nr:cobalt ECF transporter T component CbiQ [Candidatus Bipolaricaulota bacterium]MBS3792546.1 cobalt ECF transporter T component CbiQ [Candidatus Bipolaricaulota bacterium]